MRSAVAPLIPTIPPESFGHTKSAAVQEIQPECSFETITEAFEGAINVVGLGRPVEEHSFGIERRHCTDWPSMVL